MCRLWRKQSTNSGTLELKYTCLLDKIAIDWKSAIYTFQWAVKRIFDCGHLRDKFNSVQDDWHCFVPVCIVNLRIGIDCSCVKRTVLQTARVGAPALKKADISTQMSPRIEKFWGSDQPECTTKSITRATYVSRTLLMIKYHGPPLSKLPKSHFDENDE